MNQCPSWTSKSLSFFFANQSEERSEDDEVKQPGENKIDFLGMVFFALFRPMNWAVLESWPDSDSWESWLDRPPAK
jgi:hypothetical protein